MTMNTIIKLQKGKSKHWNQIMDELTSLKLKPTHDYEFKFDYQDNEVTIEFMNPMKATLWRVAVGYKYI